MAQSAIQVPLRGTPNRHDFLGLDRLLTDEERLIRDTVRGFVRAHVVPNIADWFERGELPRTLVAELGALGLFGMQLTGFGCAGVGATGYGVACMELEAGDSGLRSLV